jgi:DNA-binding FadR family transcriptional regulator
VQVAEIVTDAVLAGEHPPGSTLPSERDLARQLGVNRTSLRQALARLEQAGLVASRQGIGTVVLDPLEATDGAVVLRALVAAGPEVVGEVLEVRQALASLAGRSAATRATPAQREELVRRFDHACRCDGAPALQAAELAFFSVLVVSTGNRPLTAMMKWLERLYTATSSVFVDAFSDADAVLRDLRPVLDAVVSADPDSAERAVRDYASKSGTRLQWSVLRRSPEPAGPVPV